MEYQYTYETMSVGMQLETVVHPITKEFVAEYVASSGDAHPWHTGGPSPFDGIIAPPMMFLKFSSSTMGIGGTQRPSGGIHAFHEFHYLAPLYVGRTLTTTGEVVERYEKKGRKYISVATESIDDLGAIIGRTRFSSIFPF